MKASGQNPASGSGKSGGRVFVFLFMSVMALACWGAALVLGTEPRLQLERVDDGTFRVTGSNHFAGTQFFTKTVEGVTTVGMGDGLRDRRSDSPEERRRQARRKHLVFAGADGASLHWDRETDELEIRNFLRGAEPRLALREEPPWWRMVAAWGLAGFGVLVFLGGVRGLFLGAAAAPPTKRGRLP